jgi:pimeloyl-ACP methyl ester carboxylesterase
MRYFVAPGEDRRLDAASRRGLRGSFVELSDGVTHYELSGPDHGEVAVLVGGLTIPLFYWDALAAELHVRGLRTLAYSGYGRGYSDRVQARYDEALFVRQLTELTRSVGLPRPHHVIGTSMGAVIAMAYADRHAACAATLTLVGPTGLAPRTAWPNWLLRSDLLAGFIAKRFGLRLLERHLGHNVRDPDRAAQLADMVADAYRYEGSMYALFATLQTFRVSGRDKLYRRTAASGVPTILLWGADDRVIPTDQLEAARTLLRPLECCVIPDCGHMAPFERPRDIAGKIAAFAACRTERHAR